MTLQFVPNIILYFVSVAVAGTLAFITWRIRPARSSTWIALLVFMIIWTIGGILEATLTDLHLKTVAITAVTYLGVGGVIFFWPLFTIIYSNHEHWLNKYTIALLALIPVTNYLIVNTYKWHQFYWTNRYLIEINGAVFFEADHGFWFVIWTIYGYAAIIFGALLLVTSIIRSPRVYQGQALVLILGGLFPLVANFFYFLGINPIAPLDLSPVSFVLSSILITIGILRFRLFDLTPIAHDLVFKGVTSGVLMIDLNDNIIDLNPAAELILNRTKNEIIGKNMFALFPQYQDLIKQIKDLTNTRTEIALGATQSIYEVQIMPLTNRRGQLAGRIVLFYDITEQKRAVAERDKLINELDAYASTVAHDLKNPLNLIVGHANLIKRKNKTTLPAKAKDSLDIIAKTSVQMAQIIDSLLLLANVRHIEDIQTEALDTAVLINNAWGRLANLAEKHQAELILPSEWPAAIGYASWVEEVWSNYLSNAIKYGGTPPQITAGWDIQETHQNGTAHICFWVQDNGDGLSHQETAQLFQQFSRLDQHSKLQGHGLGLSIVKSILEKLGGTFGVESELGQGSTFFFTLPLAPEEITVEVN